MTAVQVSPQRLRLSGWLLTNVRVNITTSLYDTWHTRIYITLALLFMFFFLQLFHFSGQAGCPPFPLSAPCSTPGKDLFSIKFLIIEEGCSKTKVRGRRYRSEHFLAPCSSFSPLNVFVLVLSREEEPATAKGRSSSTETADRKNIEKILEGKATCRRDRMTYRKPGPGRIRPTDNDKDVTRAV